MKILIVEDDKHIAKVLITILNYHNYIVEIATDGQAAWNLVQAFHYDLILLDVILPKLDGISLCQRLREQGFTMPVILLTGQNSSFEKARGLDAGADDYIVKPFDSQELVARVRALLRRSHYTVSPTLEWGHLRLDPSSLAVSYNASPLQLTSKEYALLELFMRNPHRVFSCNAILEHAWSFENTPTEEAVRTQIKGLRNKLKAAGAASDLIETVYGVGYRLKALQSAFCEGAESETSNRQQQQTLGAFTGIWNRFKERISPQVSVLEQVAEACMQETLNQELLALARQQTNMLESSLGNFGFSKGAQLVRAIKHYLQPNQSLDTQEAKHLRKLVLALLKEIEYLPQKLVSKSVSYGNERPRLLIVESDRQLAHQLVKEAEIQGVPVEMATTLSEARDIIARTLPNIVLLDPDIGNTPEEGLALLAQLTLQKQPIPVLVFTAHSSLETRLEVARLGGCAFLQKPIPVHDVLRAVLHRLQPTGIDAEAVVMVVDRDRQILATVRTVLEPWGFKVITLDNTQRFWETLEASTPNMLILDTNLPNMSGLELCQVVRNDSRWSGLPILFFATCQNTVSIHKVFAAGADDFISKPIVEPELVTRILNRLERIELQRSLADIDPLTRVYNRHRATQDLNTFLRLSQRYNQPLCFAILDLDNFKQVNSTFGHAAGDAVLRYFGQLLRQSFRGEDVVARWGGDEFVVGMYGMSRSDGVERLIQLQAVLHHQEFAAPNNSKFRVTFSTGIASYPDDGNNLESLYQVADTAVEVAKRTVDYQPKAG
jgi:diguanylate cyclase (GGDEF)-like protein